MTLEILITLLTKINNINNYFELRVMGTAVAILAMFFVERGKKKKGDALRVRKG